MTESETAEAAFARCHAITGHGPVVPNRIAELEAQVADLKARNRSMGELSLQQHTRFAAMVQSRNAALLRMEAAIATSNGLINAEVQRRIAEAKAIAESPHQSPHLIAAPPRLAFPSRALRHQRQPGGLLSTADAGRVRLGGYAPTLPPR